MSKKLKDVVTTIQQEQNDIIRAFKNKPIIIQGSAGSGKTTVALHRLAYLVYTYGDEMNNRNILVVAPNELFLDYISDILPNLGVSNVKQVTFENLCQEITKGKMKIITKDKKLSEIIESDDVERIKYITTSSKIKGTMTYKTILDRLIRILERENIEVEDIKIDGFTLYSARDIRRLYIKDLVKLPINKRKDEIQKYFKGKLKNRLEKFKEEIEHEYFFKIKDIKSKTELSEEQQRKEIIKTYDERDELINQLKPKAVKALNTFFKDWKTINPLEGYIRLFNDEEVFEKATDNCIPKKRAHYMISEFNDNLKKKVLDADDLAAVTYLDIVLNGLSTEEYIHTVIDEAQDYSFLQMVILKEISKNNSMTIVGDIGQGIYSYSEIESIDSLVEEIHRLNKKTIAVVCKDFDKCRKLHKVLNKKSAFKWDLVGEEQDNMDVSNLIIPSYTTKGLEFDAVIVYDCDSLNYRDNDLDKKLLYVALTRALHIEYVLYKRELSHLLK